LSVARGWLGIAMIAVCFARSAEHPQMRRQGRQDLVFERPLPGSKELQSSPPPPAVKGADAKKGPPASPAAAGAVVFPEMQTGKWKLQVVSKGRTRDSEMCGNPIDSFAREVQDYAATTKWGCTMTTNASVPAV
jgi:hypothetical protein